MTKLFFSIDIAITACYNLDTANETEQNSYIWHFKILYFIFKE